MDRFQREAEVLASLELDHTNIGAIYGLVDAEDSRTFSGAKFQISAGGGTEPTWRKDGTELFYLAADRNLMTVPIKLGATLEAGAPKSLFPITLTGQSRSFAVANDGQRFLIGTSAGGEKALPMTVVLNWQAGLKK
jgi:hypothetical protein